MAEKFILTIGVHEGYAHSNDTSKEELDTYDIKSFISISSRDEEIFEFLNRPSSKIKMNQIILEECEKYTRNKEENPILFATVSCRDNMSRSERMRTFGFKTKDADLDFIHYVISVIYDSKHSDEERVDTTIVDELLKSIMSRLEEEFPKVLVVSKITRKPIVTL